jgi:hypothetical protein
MRQRRKAEEDDEEDIIASAEAAGVSSPPPLKRPRLTAANVPMLHSILSHLPLKPPQQQLAGESAAGGLKVEEGEWGSEMWEQQQRLGSMTGLSSLLQNPNQQLASLLTAAAKLKQVAEKAMREFNTFFPTLSSFFNFM